MESQLIRYACWKDHCVQTEETGCKNSIDEREKKTIKIRAVSENDRMGYIPDSSK